MRPNLIAFSGKIGSGKDQVYKFFNESIYYTEQYQNIKFATPVRRVISIVTGIPYSALSRRDVKNRTVTEVAGEDWSVYKIMHNKYLLDVESYTKIYATKLDAIKSYKDGIDGYPEKFDPTVREFTQMVGTDCFRYLIHPDTWCKATFADYEEDYWWAITDLRFKNEANYIKDRDGILIRVNRPCKECSSSSGHLLGCSIGDNEHHSEKELDNYKGFDYVINNDGSLDKLYVDVKNLIKQIDQDYN